MGAATVVIGREQRGLLGVLGKAPMRTMVLALALVTSRVAGSSLRSIA